MTTMAIQDYDSPCGLCGEQHPPGFAVWAEGEKVVRLCHPEDPRNRDCYAEWQGKKLLERWSMAINDSSPLKGIL